MQREPLNRIERLRIEGLLAALAIGLSLTTLAVAQQDAVVDGSAKEAQGGAAKSEAAGDAAGAPEAAPAAGTPDAGATHPARSRAARKHQRASAAQTLKEHVKALTKELDLDAKQQAAVREVLIQERVAILGLRKRKGAAAQDIVAASQSIVMRTRGEIRALLNEEQRRKFIVDVPQDQLGPAQADLNYWLGATRSKPSVAADAKPIPAGAPAPAAPATNDAGAAPAPNPAPAPAAAPPDGEGAPGAPSSGAR